jgi:hypothetical protein
MIWHKLPFTSTVLTFEVVGEVICLGVEAGTKEFFLTYLHRNVTQGIL